MKKGLRSIRPLSRDSLRGVEPGKVAGKLPKFEIVDPSTLYVEESYQRDVRENGTRLIRNIVAKFSWARFKPPVCVRLPESGNILVCIDGQHTATAAASHPDVPKIPVMVVDATDVKSRAASFVGHNRDRLGLTPMAIYRAEVGAGEELALAMDRACRAAGVTILQASINLSQKHPVGATIAIGAIRRIAKVDGEAFLTRVLTLLVRAGRGPIKSHEITAVASIARADTEAKMDLRLVKIVASKTSEQWSAIAARVAADNEDGFSLPEALAGVWLVELDERIGQPAPKAVPAPAKAPPVAPPPPPVPTPPPAQINEPAPAPPPAAPQPVKIVVHNGVSLDLGLRTVTFRGREDRTSDDGIRLVEALARVMPALLPADILAKRVFGKPGSDPNFSVRTLADGVNRTLADVRLEVRAVSNMGWMLADLDA